MEPEDKEQTLWVLVVWFSIYDLQDAVAGIFSSLERAKHAAERVTPHIAWRFREDAGSWEGDITEDKPFDLGGWLIWSANLDELDESYLANEDTLPKIIRDIAEEDDL